MAVAAEEHGREIVEVYSRRCVGGDWRAAQALMSRSYGKPRATRRARCSRARHDVERFADAVEERPLGGRHDGEC
jgi:hypothetical protein